MLITNRPLKKYLPDLKKFAYRNGFHWMMLLVAREMDYPKGYDDLINGWPSFDSVSGEHVMFLISGSMGRHLGLNYHYGEMDICGDVSIILNHSGNDEDIAEHLPILTKDVCSGILKKQTFSANSMKDYFNLKETDLPCLLMYPTIPDDNEKESRYVFHMENVEIYKKVKEIMSNLEKVADKYPNVSEILSSHKYISSREKKFIKAKEYIEANCLNEKIKSADELIQYLDEKKDRGVFLKNNYDHKTIGFINRYNAIIKDDPSIINSIKPIENYEQEQQIVQDYYLESSCILKSIELNNKIEHGNDSLSLAKYILEEYKHWIEFERGSWVLEGKTEKDFQRTINLIASYICRENNWDLSPETDIGRGPVDFKLSRGNDKTVIEVKLSSNDDCVHGIQTQIEEYAKAEKTNNKIFLIIDNDKNSNQVDKVREARDEMLKEDKHPAEIIVIDAVKKKSASNY